MTPDYRALCADLLDWAERTSAHYVVHPDVVLRARATLAQPEPEGVTDEDLLGLACKANLVYPMSDGSGFGTCYTEETDIQVEVLDYARAAIAADRARCARPTIQPVPRARPEDEYHEDMGAVLWWRFPIDEPPYCGSPLDSEWPGYHTHFTPLGPMPTPTP